MKRFFISLLCLICAASVFAIDYSSTSTRILETLTSDEIFVAQVGNDKELVLILEKAYKYAFGPETVTRWSSPMNFEEKVETIKKSFQAKKEYDLDFESAQTKQKRSDVFDEHHYGFTYDQIVEVINTFKSRLSAEKPTYYVTAMKDGNSSYYYFFVYEIKTKKVYLERCDRYNYSHESGYEL